MKRMVARIAALGVATFAIWFTWAAVRAHSNLVTLKVRNAELADVVRTMEWQTWETIVVQPGLEGRVTLQVRKAPLEQVLSIVGEQTGSRWTAMYPLYSSRRSLKRFQLALKGDIDPDQSGWTNLYARGFSFRGAGMFADVLRSENDRVSLVLENKDIGVATLALARFGPAQVVPEDGTQGTLNLTLQEVSMPEAVARVARAVQRKWACYYTLQEARFGRRGGGEGRPRERRGLAEVSSTNNPVGDTNSPGQELAFERRGPPPEMRSNFVRMMEAQLETMTPEQRDRVLQERQRFEEMRNLPPEERRQRFEQMAQSPEFQQRIQSRMLSGIKNTTPEQRVERDRRRLEMQQRFQQRNGAGR